MQKCNLIKTYYNSKDRFGVEEDVGSANLVFGYIQEGELNNKNIVDDYIDHYRFMT